MNRRCLNCMKVFMIPEGYENDDNCCPFCGFIENTLPQNVSYLRTGVVLKGRYTVGTVIGAGGFGITYKAWDNTLDTIVAVKEFFPQGIVLRDNTTTKTNTVSVYNVHDDSYEHGKERFLKEAKSLAKFNSHPGTVAIYDYFEENDTAYIVMEYLDGCNMKEYVAASGTFPSFEMLQRMTESVCDVLEAVHSVGLIHRDISPDNIFMCQNGTFKLIDFGSVKQGINNNNLSATVILKHGYAPIEQYSKSGKVGPWTDIYSLGATIYKLATGVLPQESVERLSDDELVDICKLNNNIPRDFGEAVMKALSPQIKDRYKSISEFRSDIEANKTDVSMDTSEVVKEQQKETRQSDEDDVNVSKSGMDNVEENEAAYVVSNSDSLDEEIRRFGPDYWNIEVSEGSDDSNIVDADIEEEDEEENNYISMSVLLIIIALILICVVWPVINIIGSKMNKNRDDSSKQEIEIIDIKILPRDEKYKIIDDNTISYGTDRISYTLTYKGEGSSYLSSIWTFPDGEKRESVIGLIKTESDHNATFYNQNQTTLKRGVYILEIYNVSGELLSTKRITIK